MMSVISLQCGGPGLPVLIDTSRTPLHYVFCLRGERVLLVQQVGPSKPSMVSASTFETTIDKLTRPLLPFPAQFSTVSVMAMVTATGSAGTRLVAASSTVGGGLMAASGCVWSPVVPVRVGNPSRAWARLFSTSSLLPSETTALETKSARSDIASLRACSVSPVAVPAPGAVRSSLSAAAVSVADANALEQHEARVRRRLSLLPPAPGSSDVLLLQESNYVDKTAMVAQALFDKRENKFLVATSMRRSGKSMIIKMMAAMARGERAAFDGYAVNHPSSAFPIGAKQYSVMQLDFSGVVPAEVEFNEQGAKAKLIDLLVESAMSQHGLQLHRASNWHLGDALKRWVNALRAKDGGLPIVLLIDEYDAPVTAQLSANHPERAQVIANLLMLFYTATKSLDHCFAKVFVTGMRLSVC